MYSELELRNQLNSTFVSPIMEENLPHNASIIGKKKNIDKIPEQSKDNPIFNIEPSF